MADTGYKSPSATGEDFNNWDANPSYVYASDDSRAVVYSDHTQDFYNLAFGIPAGATIDGIILSCEARASGPPNVYVYFELSWNGGTAYTTSGKSTYHPSSSSDSVVTCGGATDKWGRTWADTDFSDANFRIKGWANGAAVDHIQVKIYYTAGGASGPANLKSYNTNLKANIKSINTNLIANVKSLNTNV